MGRPSGHLADACIRTLQTVVLLWVVSAEPGPAAEAGVLIRNGDSVAFLGDSITAAGASYGNYCRLVVHGLKTKGIVVTPVLAGVPGNTSEHMLARLDRDVLSKKPDWVFLAAGVNDIWQERPSYTVRYGARR